MEIWVQDLFRLPTWIIIFLQISGNILHGIVIKNDNTVIVSNSIGISLDGKFRIANQGNGIFVDGNHIIVKVRGEGEG